MDARWELDTLKDLGDLGMRLARASVVEAEARAATPDVEGAKSPDPSLAFSRLSRAVRLTVMLHARIRTGDLSEADRRARAASNAFHARAQAELEDRRLTGRLRRSMARFIAGTAVEALEREAPETERLFDVLDDRLCREDQDDADFAEIDVKETALAICQDLGLDPGPDWWLEGWGISPPPKGAAFGGGGKEGLAASGAASASSSQVFRTG